MSYGSCSVAPYEFDLAQPADDVDLRRILRMTPMPGKISVTFQREPSFFDASVVEGDFHQTIICRDSATGQAVGFGCRSVRARYVNGQPLPVGYLSLLRLVENHRNLGLVARGYRYFRDLHNDQKSRRGLDDAGSNTRCNHFSVTVCAGCSVSRARRRRSLLSLLLFLIERGDGPAHPPEDQGHDRGQPVEECKR